MKRTIQIFMLPLAAFILASWGNTGHRKISGNAVLSFNEQMEQFVEWKTILEDHASDADNRKSDDPDESRKHYIDIDNYSEFGETGRIPQTFDSVVDIHGRSFVYDNGTLPWATLTTYDSLVNCFKRRDWDKAALFASDLGHYVADGHMPLHITKNYNGQLTDNYGIHARFESVMINKFIGQIQYQGREIAEVANVPDYIFNYLYDSYIYVDSIIAADNYAKSVNSNTSSDEYVNALWEYSKGFTPVLFEESSHSLAELLYTAWLQAGSPSIYDDNTSNTGTGISSSSLLSQNTPNPFSYSTSIDYSLPSAGKISLNVLDIKGNIFACLDKGYKPAGSHSLHWSPASCPEGIYFLVLTTSDRSELIKMVKQP